MKKYIDINDVYPVGSIYLSINDTNPSNLFGGNWEQIQDVFLLGCGAYSTAGDIGGNENHTLAVEELPSHKHSFVKVVENGTAKANIPTWPESINPGEGLTDYWHINFTHERDVNKEFYPYTSWAAEIGATGNS